MYWTIFGEIRQHLADIRQHAADIRQAALDTKAKVNQIFDAMPPGWTG